MPSRYDLQTEISQVLIYITNRDIRRKNTSLMKKHLIGLIPLLCLIITSCSTPKNITYMQGFDNNEVQQVRAQRRITIQPDDKLSIVVSSRNPELAEVFNLAVAQYRIGAVNTSYNQYTSLFTVDPDGYVNYPLIGKIHLAGLNRHEAAEVVEKKIIGNDLLKDPVVTVEFMNATVSVLGDVARPGEYDIDKDNMTILQAISKAGDLNITGLRDHVLVIREENGQDRAYRLDLTDTESLMQSPAYYMQQNDVVYIEPNDTKKRQATTTGNTVLTPTFWISVASLLTTITALIIK